MLRRLSRREQRIFNVCISLIFIYVTFNWVIKPMNERLEIMDKQIDVNERKLNRQLSMMNKSMDKNQEYDAYLSAFKQVDTDEQVMSKVIAQIEKTAGDLRLRISDLKPKRVKDSDFIKQFSVSLTIDSEFIGIMQFLYILQKQPHLFNIEEVRFDKGSRRKSKLIKTRIILTKILIP